MSSSDELSNYWSPVYNAFNPFQPVPPERLDAWFVERPDSPLSAILTHFRPQHLPERLILVGHRSSGKSSELARLATWLAKPEHGYFVVNLDLSRNVNNINQVNQLEVLFLIGAAVYKLAQEAKLTPDKNRFDALVKSLESIVQTYTENKEFSIDTASLLRGLVCFGAGVVAGPLGAVVAAGVTETLRDFIFVSGTDTSIVRKVEVEPQIREMLGHVNAILSDVMAKANGPLALLVDGLEFVQNEEVAELLFVRNRFLADVACRMLYTVPVFVYYQPRFALVRQAFQTVPFPNVRLRQRDNPEKQDEAGYTTMRQVINRRLESVGYKPEAVITRDAVNLLVSASGGLMRDLIRLMRDACVQAEIAGQRTIVPQIASRAVAALRREYRAQLTPKYQRVLDEVRKTHQRAETPECDLMLAGNFILSYSNEEIWYDVHSILW
jgi:hypothetical protein